MKNLLSTLLTLLLRLLLGLWRFLRARRTLPIPAAASPAPPAPVPSVFSEIEAQLDAQIAEFDQWEREYNREQRAYRKLLRDQARARGELSPPKPRSRKPRPPKPRSTDPKPPNTSPLPPPQPTILPQALPEARLEQPAHALDPSPLSLAAPPAPRRPLVSLRSLFSRAAKILAAPLRILRTAILALPRLFFPRRPPSDGPPTARPAAPPRPNRAA